VNELPGVDRDSVEKKGLTPGRALGVRKGGTDVDHVYKVPLGQKN